MLNQGYCSGGFAGKECYVETEGSLKVLDFYPEDSNKLQYFYLKERVNVKKIRQVLIFFVDRKEFVKPDVVHGVYPACRTPPLPSVKLFQPNIRP